MLFFPATVVVYFLIPKKFRQLWLMVASYVFYMCWNSGYALLLLGITIITYLGAVLTERYAEHKKLILAVILVIAFAFLFIFKYFGLFTGQNLGLILPVGISFYTFKAAGYLIDVYRGDVIPEKNFLRYALFVSFFPQLAAGPIDRAGNLMPQIEHIHEKNLLDYERISSGVILMIWGYFLKMVVADRAAIFVNAVYGNIYIYGTVELIVATFVFALQIYCDFMSYSVIALGAGKIMGFDLPENFDTPYFAISIKDFWRRWHISLSTWFRDYLYIPLGGNRKGKLRKYVNLMIVFLVSGLWHGAAWTYVVWGGLHGLYQIVEDASISLRKKMRSYLRINESAFSFKCWKVLTTFAMVCIAWVFFRAASVGEAIDIFKRMLTVFNPWVLYDNSLIYTGMNPSQWNILIASVCILIIAGIIKYKRNENIDTVLLRQNMVFRWIVLGMMIFSIVIYGVYGPNFNANSFIYLQF